MDIPLPKFPDRERERDRVVHRWTMAIFGSSTNTHWTNTTLKWCRRRFTLGAKTKDRCRRFDVRRSESVLQWELMTPTGCCGDVYSLSTESLDYIYICALNKHQTLHLCEHQSLALFASGCHHRSANEKGVPLSTTDSCGGDQFEHHTSQRALQDETSHQWHRQSAGQPDETRWCGIYCR